MNTDSKVVGREENKEKYGRGHIVQDTVEWRKRRMEEQDKSRKKEADARKKVDRWRKD